MIYTNYGESNKFADVLAYLNKYPDHLDKWGVEVIENTIQFKKLGLGIVENGWGQALSLSYSKYIERASWIWLNPLVLLVAADLCVPNPYNRLCILTSFLAQPIFNYLNPEVNLPISLHITEELEDQPIVDSELIAEVRTLAQKAGIEKKINIYEAPGFDWCSAAAIGNAIGERNAGIVFTASHIFPSIMENSEMPKGTLEKKARSFLIAHELAHIKNNDLLYSDLFQTALSYSLFGAAYFLGPKSGLGVILGITGILRSPLLKLPYLYYRESQADLFAAKLLGDTEGGIAILKHAQEVNLKERNSTAGSWIWNFVKQWAITPAGDYRLDLAHPPLTQRINQLKSLCLDEKCEDLKIAIP